MNILNIEMKDNFWMMMLENTIVTLAILVLGFLAYKALKLTPMLVNGTCAIVILLVWTVLSDDVREYGIIKAKVYDWNEVMQYGEDIEVLKIEGELVTLKKYKVDKK